MIRTRALLAAALVSLAVTGHAAAQAYPTDRGSFIVSGSAGAYTSTTTLDIEGDQDTENRYSEVYVAPQVQYFVMPGLAVGGRVTVNAGWYEGDSRTQFGVGPQLSYYFGRDERRLYPYVSAGVSYDGFGNGEANLGQNAQAGLAFMLSRGVGLDSGIYYRGITQDEIRQDIFGLAIGITAFVF